MGLEQDKQDALKETLHREAPNWDPDTVDGMRLLEAHHQALHQGLIGAVRRPTNLNKIVEVFQGPTKSPMTYLEYLQEACQTYTPCDPEASKNALICN